MDKTIIIKRDYAFFVHKYQRYERRNSKISAHLPPCLEIHEGDIVKIAETRRLSKTVAFVVIDKLKDAAE
jgi:small subunit ribosomal protein S17